MKRTPWNGFAAVLAALALLFASPSALAAKKKKTPTPAAEAAADKADTSDKAEKVNLNTASEKEIAAAKGVSDTLAKELVKNRPYKTWDEVSKVKGVGTGKKLASLKKVLKLSGGEAAAKDEPSAKDSKGKKSKSSSKADEAAAPAAAASGKAAASSEPSSPSKKSSSSSSENAAAPKLAPGERININTASAEELEKLPEIGPVKAAAIVEYRKANGRFASIDDVMKVSGIKEATFAKIKDSIVVR